MTTTGLTIPFLGLKKQYHNLRQEILDVTDEVLRSGVLMEGNYTAEFSHWLKKTNNTKYAILCHSGTQALEIIAQYMADYITDSQLPTVIVPALTYPATANAWVRSGWNLHILDTDSHGQINYKTLEKDVKYHAVCLVGLYGQSIKNHWPKFDDAIVEDAAQHWLAENSVRRGIASAISFDPTKNLSNYGNGGAVLTDSYELSQYAKDYIRNGKYHRHANVGTNSRMSEVDCAQMLVKTKYITSWQQRRYDIAKYWIDKLKNTSVRSLIDDSNFKDHCYHKFVIDVDNRDILQRNLAIKKVETKVHYADPLQELPAFQHYQSPNALGASYSLSRRCLSLPIYPELTDLEVEYVIDTVLAHAE